VRQSNGYIIFYATLLAVVCAGMLVGANLLLRDRQTANVELEQKKNILATVIDLDDNSNIEELYNQKVKEYVVNYKGEIQPGVSPKQVVIASEYRKPVEERLLPVYEFRNEQDTSKVDYAVFPVFGAGLWDAIWGFIALESDMNTVKGVKFEHKGETPGLGARIVEDEVQNRFRGKEVYEGSEIVAVRMMKGEGNDWSGNKHRVDGLSGATLTANGVNNMLKEYLVAYEAYMQKNKAK
jgi:Na+-transporting NADH:ubiquinone oxidoreductase subunit C